MDTHNLQNFIGVGSIDTVIYAGCMKIIATSDATMSRPARAQRLSDKIDTNGRTQDT